MYKSALEEGAWWPGEKTFPDKDMSRLARSLLASQHWTLKGVDTVIWPLGQSLPPLCQPE